MAHRGHEPSGETPAGMYGEEQSMPGRALVKKKGRHHGKRHGKRKAGKRG